MSHRQLPPSVNYAQPNAALVESSAFYVNTQLQAWPQGETPRRAGVSSFGLGGTNVHMVLEEGPQREASSTSRTWQVLPISARSEGALQAARAQLAAYLREEPTVALADVAYTLQVGRAGFAQRSVVICREREEAIEQLEQAECAVVERRDRPVAVVLADEGAFSAQYIRELYAQETIFRQEVDACCELLKVSQGLDMRAFLLTQNNSLGTSLEVLTRLSLFITQYALARTFMRWGIQPSAFYGSGRTEYTAACLAGTLSPKEALLLVMADAQQKTIDIQPSALHTPQVATISALTGTWVSSEQVTDPYYWAQQRSFDAPTSLQAYARLREIGAILLHIGSPARDTAVDGKDTITLLSESTNTQPALKTLLDVLGGLWLHSVTCDWSMFSAGEQRQRVGLPTYPFERQRYWVDSPEEQLLKQHALPASVSEKLALDDWFYTPTWQRQPLAGEILSAEHLPHSPLLLFMDESGLSACLAEKLTTMGKTVIRVSPSTHYLCLDTYNYVIRPAERGDYQHLCQDLLASKCFPQAIVHTWGVEATPAVPNALTRAHFEHAQERGFYSLLWLAQALGKHVVDETIQMYVLASQVLSLTTAIDLAPEKAPILGICKVIPQEYLNITCRMIDIDHVQHPALIAHLLGELGAPSSETVVAYRKNERWVQRHQRISLVPENALPSRLHANGTYLITGGLGNIGLTLAEYLTQTVQAKVALVGRSAFPVRTSWENWLEQHTATDTVSQKIQRLLALEAQGARVLLVQADVADDAQLEAAFVQGEQ
ncbi:MAG: KR prefix domain-containing protein, partial [Ktedonobacteraceae bacterium]